MTVSSVKRFKLYEINAGVFFCSLPEGRTDLFVAHMMFLFTWESQTLSPIIYRLRVWGADGICSNRLDLVMFRILLGVQPALADSVTPS